MLPQLVLHADWSVSPAKRWQAKAARDGDGTYILHAPEPVGEVTSWLARLRDGAGSGGIFLGVDFPLGLPLAYAARAGVNNFVDLLPRLGAGEWADFYEVAAAPEDIGIRRPFYPARPGHARQCYLVEGLGVNSVDDLRRICDRAYPGRRAAAPLFWTMGAQQVGKAAITGWRDVLGPALRSATDVFLWPFAGSLEALLARGGILVAESYPAEFYGQLGLAWKPGSGGKRRRYARAAHAGQLLTWAAANPVRLSRDLVAALQDGFGETADGEDRFDAVVGLMGMLNVLFQHRSPGEPADERVRRLEGWILGQDSDRG